MRPDVSHIGLAVGLQYTLATAARAGVAAAVYVSPEVYSLPVYQEFASLRPPLGGRTRLVNCNVILLTQFSQVYLPTNSNWYCHY